MFLFQLVWFRHTWEEGVTVDIGRPYPSPCTMPIQGEGGLRPIELTFTKDQVWAIGQCTSAYAIPRAVLPFHSLRDRGPLVPRNHARAPNLGLLILAAPPPPLQPSFVCRPVFIRTWNPAAVARPLRYASPPRALDPLRLDQTLWCGGHRTSRQQGERRRRRAGGGGGRGATRGYIPYPSFPRQKHNGPGPGARRPVLPFRAQVWLRCPRALTPHQGRSRRTSGRPFWSTLCAPGGGTGGACAHGAQGCSCRAAGNGDFVVGKMTSQLPPLPPLRAVPPQ